jgi:Glycosyl transferase family 2
MNSSVQTIGAWRVTAPAAAAESAGGTAPALSVAIPYYGGQATIAGAVESVLEQTVAPLEIVICDDGSPDDLDAGLGQLRASVRVIRQPNGGISAAMNALTAACRGDYVVQLDQDDAFLPRRLEAIAEVLARRPDIDVLATDAAIELGGEQIATLEQVNPFPTGDQRAALLTTCTFMWPAVRRRTLQEHGGYDASFPVMQDWECFLRLVLGGAPMAFVHEPLYRWRLTPGSRSSHDRVENVQAMLRMTEKICAVAPLEPAERALGESLLGSRRRWLARERARHALQQRVPGARRSSLALVLGRGFDRATRVKALVAVLSPPLARRFLERRREQTDPAVEALAQRGFRWERSAGSSAAP